MDDLGPLLKQALHHAALLEAALEQEAAALDSRVAKPLGDAVALKHSAAQNLEQITRSYSDLLRQAGFAPDAAGMADWLRGKDPEGALERNWSQLQEAMVRCQRLNQINGQVVQVQQQYVGQALQILRRGDSATEVYNPAGQTETSIRSQTISKA